MSNTRLVFSTDPKDNLKCSRCQQFVRECQCLPVEDVTESKLTVVFRIEKGGRGGKTVTVMEGFPRNEEYLKKLTKEFKAKCGVGGTHLLTTSGGAIEIQGDKREQLKKILNSKGIKYKGV